MCDIARLISNLSFDGLAFDLGVGEKLLGRFDFPGKMGAMTAREKATAVIVGEGGFPRASFEKIQTIADVLAVCTRDDALAKQARSQAIPVLVGAKSLEAFVAENRTDYLFSLDNPTVLKGPLLRQVRVLSVNWHDSPLPAYGGLNATTWAIGLGEKSHASVLHEIQEGIDTGDILVRRDVTIEPDETASSLSIKCFGEGLLAMDTLIAQIKAGTVSRTPQVGEGSYYGFDAVVPRAGLIGPEEAAATWERWARALDFGHAENRLASLRMLTAGGAEPVVVWPQEVTLDPTPLNLGQSRRQGDAWLLGCAEGTLRLASFQDAAGDAVATPDALRLPTAMETERATEQSRQWSRFEEFWSKRLRQPAFEWALPRIEGQAGAEVNVAIAPAAAPAIFAAYLQRTRRQSGNIGCRVNGDFLFSDVVPLRLLPLKRRNLSEYAIAFGKELERVKRRGSFARDTLARRGLRPVVYPIELSFGEEGSASADLVFHVHDGRVWLSSPNGGYSTELSRIAQHLERLAAAESALADATFFTEDDSRRDRRGLKGAALSADARTLTSRLQEMAARAPEHAALVCEGRTTTYAELVLRVGQMASALDVEPGAQIAIQPLAPDLSCVASWAALWKRAAYIPLGDPKRAAAILEQATVGLTLDRAWIESHPLEGGPVSPLNAGPEDAVYILFTSGTTGRPKGVRVRERNLLAQLDARIAGYRSDPTRFLSLHSPAFDSFVAGFFWTLCTGGTLVLATEEERHDPFRIKQLIETHRITHLDVPPAVYSELLAMNDLDLSSLEVVIVGGEACPVQIGHGHHERAPYAKLYNEYGPTEATVYATVYEVPNNVQAPVPIGRPIAGVQGSIVDDRRKPLPPGFVGELLVAGPTVTDGYVDRPKETAARFVTDPRSGGRAYCTGDLARLNADDQIEWMGRIDGQVQVHGYRVELGAIETALEALEDVHQAAAALVKEGPRKRLCAFVVPLEGVTVDGGDLIQQLKAVLPSYSVPEHLETIASIPRTSAGKIDRKALTPQARIVEDVGEAAQGQALIIAEAMGQVLGRGALTADADFFDAGGTSFLAIRLVRILQERLGRQVSVVDLFRYPNPNGLAAVIAGEVTSDYKYLDVIADVPGDQVVFVGSIAQARMLGARLETGMIGLNIFGLDSGWVQDGDLSSLAELFVQELSAYVGTQRIVLCGFCDDTKLAAEMLPRLRKKNIDVRGFVAIDGGWMLGEGLVRKARRERLSEIAKRAFSGDRTLVDETRELIALRVRERTLEARITLGNLKYRLAALRSPAAQPAEVDVITSDQVLVRRYQHLQVAYAQSFSEEATILLSRNYRAEHVREGLRVVGLDGDHSSLFEESQVHIVVDALRDVVQDFFA